MTDKIKTYLGFCIKKGSVEIGFNNLENVKKRVRLIVMNSGVGESTRKKTVKIAVANSCPLLITDLDLSDYVLRECKIFAVTDKSLAQAILENAGKDFVLYI